MLIAALGWGIYSISGTKSKNPLTSTMSNFVFTIPIVIINFIIYPDIVNLTYFGIFLAICSGAIMSALGYSLWYTLLPYLEKTIAALVQLLVPVIALALSVLFLNEKLTIYRDPKTMLQEYSLKLYKTLPIYDVIENKGPRHKPVIKLSLIHI